MNRKICFSFFLISTVLSDPKTWQACNSSCYRFVETEQSWHSAWQYCSFNDMKLAQIEDAGEFQFIRNTLKRHYDVNAQQVLEFWIDGYYIASQRQWLWSSRNENVNFFSWAPGEPNGIENCIDLLNHEDFYMNDDKCEYAVAYICEDDGRRFGKDFSLEWPISDYTDSNMPLKEQSQVVCHVQLVKTNYKDTDLPAHYVTEDQETVSTRMNPFSDEECFGCGTISLS